MDVSKVIEKTLSKTMIGKINPNNEAIVSALSFNVRDLDTIPVTEITKMIVVLSQYIIYMTLEINKLRIRKSILERDIAVDVATFIAVSGIVKGTKFEKKALAIGSSTKLAEKEDCLQEINIEFTLLEGIDKYIEFYVNALKKELSRRDREFDFKSR